MSESFLDAIRKELQGLADTRAHLLSGSDGVQNDSDHPQLNMFCKTRLESYRREQDLFSVLVFTLSGSTSILTIVEHDLSRGRVPDVGNPQPEKLAVVKDKTSTTIMQGLINSIIDRSYFAELNGCLRVDISISNVTATITDIKIDMEPRIFCQQESFDDWMVNQNPGGHEALLCLLLTQHQQKSKRLTAKQATACAAFDAISLQLAATFDCIAHVAVMRSLAFQFTWEGTVLDVGCGQGVFGGLLALYHKGVDLYGTDMSEVMIKAPQIGQYYHMPIRIGPMEQTLISSPTFDHITCFSVFQYVTPMTLMAALSQMFLKARKSITFDIPEVPSEYARKLNSVVKLSRPTDHLPSLDRIGTPAGWKLTMHRHCLTYTEPNYGIDVYSRYISSEPLAEEDSFIRPLVRDLNATNTESLVRNHLITISDSGFLTCVGGKWTTYRQMAEETVDIAIKSFNLSPRPLTYTPDISGLNLTSHAPVFDGKCQTQNFRLVGAHGFSKTLFVNLIQQFGLDVDVAKHLAHSYGDRAWDVAAMSTPTDRNAPLANRITPNYSFIDGEIRHTINSEYAQTAVDFLARRTRLSFLNVQAALGASPRVIDLMGDELRWSAVRKEVELADTVKFLESMGLPANKFGITMEEVLKARAAKNSD
ncbi:hypothetical protein VE02_09760 [Pseudogymnoascus sp. 03VT05]|nr:hypothetical protein VE02_09760 [Pseudogymnoascus sp. 03VT05]